MNQRISKIRELFEKAIEIRTPIDQAQFLDQQCENDPELREQVEALVKAHMAAGSFLGREDQTRPPNPDKSTLDAKSQKSSQTVFGRGTIISQYKLLQQIGTGGMGAVWMAEQEEPVRRRVALKLILGDIGNQDTIARFEAERQALAMMEHPNIARVFDAGTTEGGTPWFVMELVKGIPITKYCDENKLAIRERLDLMVPVCRAVQHAHHKGIVHRDLKPSNVLVTLYDGHPVPKIIDFGLAKALAHQVRLTDKTLFTEFGKVVGTLQYMSPEQAELNALDVDTRTDIYSLGVLLYELLTGTTPIDKSTIGEKAVLQILAMIKETEPPRPSIRLSQSGDAVTGISEQRRIAPTRLRDVLKGELDWIVMKALEKDRTRRYETADSFSNDIQHFLNDETVEARAPSSAYYLKKFVRRNRGLVFTTMASFALLLAGIIGTTWGLILARQAAKEATNSKLIATDALAKVKGERDAKAKALGLLEQKNEELANQNYQSGLQNAITLIESGELNAAKRTLIELPESLRGWEWQCLLNESEPYISKVQIPNGTSFFTSDQGSIAATLKGDFVLLAVKGTEKQIKVMRTLNGAVERSIFLPKSQRILSCSMSNNARRIAILYATEANPDKGLACELVLWDSKTNRIVWSRTSSFETSEDLLSNVFLSPNGQILFSVGRQGDYAKKAKRFGGSNFGLVFRFPEDDAEIVASEHRVNQSRLGGTFTADGRYFILATYDQIDGVIDLKKLDYRNLEQIASLPVTNWTKFRNVGKASQVAIRFKNSWELIDLSDTSVTTPLIENPEWYKSICFYDGGQCVASVVENKLRCWLAGNYDVYWDVAALPKSYFRNQIIANDSERCLVVFHDSSIIRYPLPNAAQILKVSRMTPDSFHGSYYIGGGKAMVASERLGDKLVPHKPVRRAIWARRSLRNLENFKTEGFIRTWDNWTWQTGANQDSLVYQIQYRSGSDYSNPTIVVHSVLSKPSIRKHKFEIDFDDFDSPTPLVAPDGNTIVFVAKHSDAKYVNSDGSTDIVFCEFDKTEPTNRFTTNMKIKQVVDFDGHDLWIISDGELKRIQVLDGSVKSSGLEASCVAVDRKKRRIAIGCGNNVSIRSFPDLEPINVFEVTSSFGRIRWFSHHDRLFVERSNSVDCCCVDTGAVLMRLPNAWSTLVPSRGNTAILGGNFFSTVPLRERWEAMRLVEEIENAPEVRANALSYVLEQDPKDVRFDAVLGEQELSHSERRFAGHLLAVAFETVGELEDEGILEHKAALSYLSRYAKETKTEELNPVFRWMLESWKPEPSSLNAAAWNSVVKEGNDEDYYALALDRAKRAVEAEPSSRAYINTLGVAQFRCGKFEQAIESLLMSVSAHETATNELPDPYDTGFLAMSYLMKCDAENASKYRNQFDTAFENNERSNDKDLLAIRQEVKEAFVKFDKQ